jgi:predicted benzoate:H+ symporter BenE
MMKAFSKKLVFGAVIAFAVATVPFTIGGISSAFWALVAGLAASLVVERAELIDHWDEDARSEDRSIAK